jgi:CrcB protein
MKGVADGFPWGTMVVNLLGCFLIGLFAGYLNKSVSDGGVLALFLTYGICGGFTTFSTFSRESLIMLQSGNYWGVISYVAISVVVGIILTACGYMLAQ